MGCAWACRSYRRGTFSDLDVPKAEQFFIKLQSGEVRAGRPTHKGGKPKPREPASAATVRGYKVTLKAFGRYLQRRGTWPSNPFDMLQTKKLERYHPFRD